MTISVFGVLVIAIGGWLLLRSSATAMLVFTMLMTLLGGSAAFILTAMGNVSIPPAIVAAIFLVLRCILPGSGLARGLQDGIGDNALLILFALYGALGAMILPHIFAGAIDVVPLRPMPKPGDALATYPLSFSTQNITVALYLTATMLGGICAYAAVQREGAERAVARAAAATAMIHALLGFASVAFAGTALAGILSFFRNGTYAQLNQAFGGLVRMNGIFAEPSIFAAYGFAWMVFVAELWLRDIEKSWTGPALLLLFVALVASTSSTGYLGLASYAIVLAGRQLIFPSTVPAAKAIWMVALMFLALIGISTLILFRPELFEWAWDLLAKLTLDKSDSESGMQRMILAKQGILAFWASGGLGVGPGSFRSSSLLTAILGSVGIIGISAFLLHLLRILRPLRQSTYVRAGDMRVMVGAAASWTAIVMLAPISLSAASPDPGLVWGLMGGIALGLRGGSRAGAFPTESMPLHRHAKM